MNTRDPPLLCPDHSHTATSHVVSLVSSRISCCPLAISPRGDTLAIRWILAVSPWGDFLAIFWMLAVRRDPCYPLDTRCLAVRRLPCYTLYCHSVFVRKHPMRRLPVLLWTLVLHSAVLFLETSTLFQTTLSVSFSQRHEKFLVVSPFNSKALA
jgi:hypothetical protein